MLRIQFMSPSKSLNNRLTPKADRRTGPLGLQEAQDRSQVTGLLGTMLGQLGDFAFDGGTQPVGVFELIGLLALTGGLEQGL